MLHNAAVVNASGLRRLLTPTEHVAWLSARGHSTSTLQKLPSRRALQPTSPTSGLTLGWPPEYNW